MLCATSRSENGAFIVSRIKFYSIIIWFDLSSPRRLQRWRSTADCEPAHFYCSSFSSSSSSFTTGSKSTRRRNPGSNLRSASFRADQYLKVRGVLLRVDEICVGIERFPVEPKIRVVRGSCLLLPMAAGVSFSALGLVCFCLLLLLGGAHCRTHKRDVKALNEIKASLGWRVVYAWVGDDPCGDGDLPPWSGVTCSTQQGDYRVVTELEVYAVSIVGPFPTAVTNLLDLTRLDLHNNKLTGPLPPQIGKLKHLRSLNLRWNKLQDVIPPEIGELKKLTHLHLSFNNFKGEIPKELADLPELRYLYLHENRFVGRIPPELGNLPNLRHLDVSSNHLTGTIRDLIRITGNGFPSLRNLYLNNNQLTGGIPEQLANLTNLEILYLSYNRMSGIVPARIASIPRLTYLYLDHNSFSGRMPDAFYKHPFLKEIYVDGNLFKSGTKSKGSHKVLEVSDTEFLV